MNIAIISSFAAKESLVGTLGAIFSSQGADDKALSASMAEQGGWTVWHALAILVFIALFPPCLATLVMIRHETGSNSWTAFAGIYPIVLGFILAVCVFQFGQLI
jgi:ferrous iron transport protein B